MPRSTAALSASELAKIYKTRTSIALNDGAQPGLVFRCGKTGASWSVLASGPTGRKRITLGSYPSMGLAQARERARIMRETHGLAPADSVRPLSELLDEYAKADVVKSWPRQRMRIVNVFGSLMGTQCGSLTLAGLQRLVDRYPARANATHALASLRPVLTWGRKRGWLTMDARDLERPKGGIKKRQRFLSEDELRRVIPHIQVGKGLIMWLLLLTGCRLNEIAELPWSEVQLDDDPRLEIPKERRKGETSSLTVPLSTQAVAALSKLPRGGVRVFAGVAKWSDVQARVFALSGTSGWHRHDLRRTAATYVGRLGFAPYIAEAVLGHKHLVSGLASVYNTHRYLKEHREALQNLADFYTKLVD